MSVTPMCYETQFFEFTPQTCILRMYVSFQDHLFDMLRIVESVILNKIEKLPNCGIGQLEVRKSSMKYLTSVNKCFNQLFQKMETCLLKLVFTIPRNVLLPEDRVQEVYPDSRRRCDTLHTEAKSLEAKYKAEVLATQALLAELEEQRVVQAELAKILAWFDGMDKICREHGNNDLLESFAFMAQTSKKLQGTVQEIELKHKKLKLDGTCKKAV